MTEPVELIDRPVFICGLPKSGTNLLRAVLDGHPDLVVFPEETKFFRTYLPASVGKPLDEQLCLAEQTIFQIFNWNQRDEAPDRQAGNPHRLIPDVPQESIRSALRTRISRTNRHPGDMLAAVVLAYGDAVGAIHSGSMGWVERTPFHELYTKQIFAWWSMARCIHVVRDPRDNFISHRKEHPEFNATLFGRSWKTSTEAGVKAQRKYGKERYWIVRYEDLVSDPQTVLGSLCTFLGIREDAVPRQSKCQSGNMQEDPTFSGLFHAITPQAVGRWQGQLTPMELKVLDWYDGRLLKILGY